MTMSMMSEIPGCLALEKETSRIESSLATYRTTSQLQSTTMDYKNRNYSIQDITSLAKLLPRRNGKHNIYSGVDGDEVLSLFMKYNHMELDYNQTVDTMENINRINISRLQTVDISKCSVIDEYFSLPMSKSMSMKNVLVDEELLNICSCKCSGYDNTDDSSLRLCHRRNGLCYTSNDALSQALIARKHFNKQKAISNFWFKLFCHKI